MADRAGQQLGNYRLIQKLGEGGFADVYLGEHIYLKTQAAIKILHTRLASDDMEEFLNEARTVARLEHPHIVRVLEFGREDNTPFLVMSYAPNGTLRQRHPKGTRVPFSTITTYVEQIAGALQYAHDQKLIHRDIKPENILLGNNNDLLLSDFGIAVVSHGSRSMSMQDKAGTVHYMAPEQIKGQPRPASDQYALAVMVYEWLAGARPFNGPYWEVVTQQLSTPPPSLREKVPTIPAEVEQVIMTALAKDPHQRFTSVRAFANALKQASRIETPPPSVPSTPPATLVPEPPVPSTRAPLISVSPASPPTPALPPSAPVSKDKVQVEPLPGTSPFVPPNKDTTQFGPFPGRLTPATSKIDDSYSPSLRPASSPFISPSRTIPLLSTKQKRSRLFYPTVALLVFLVIVLVGGGSYFFFFLRQGPTVPPVNVAQSIQQAQSLIAQAKSVVTTDPATALHDLASAQSKLLSLPSAQLTAAQSTQVTQLLQGDLTTTTKSAIQNYNQHANISVLPCAAFPAASTSTAINTVSTGTQAQRIATLQDAAGTSFFYALGLDKNLYQLTQQHSLMGPITLSGKPQVVDLSSDGTQLLVLMRRSSPNSYSFGFLLPNQTGLRTTTSINNAWLTSNQSPILLAAQGSVTQGEDVYVVLASPLTANGTASAQVVEYVFDAKGKLLGTPKPIPFMVTGNIVSVAAFSGHLLFLLLDTGTVESLQLGSGTPTPTAVLVRPPLPFPLAGSATAFTSTTPVPTVSSPVAATGTVPLLVSGNGAVAASVVAGTPRLAIADPANRRVLTLVMAPTPTGGGVAGGTTVTLQVLQQYVSAALLAQMQSVTENTKGVVDLLEQSSASAVSLVSIDTSVQTAGNCT